MHDNKCTFFIKQLLKRRFHNVSGIHIRQYVNSSLRALTKMAKIGTWRIITNLQYLENGLDGPMAHQVQKTWAGGMGAALGPHWVQGNALVGVQGGKAPEKIWVFRHFKGHFFLNSDTYFSPKMSRNTLRKKLEQFLFLFSLRFYLLFSNWNTINNTDWGLQ